MKQVASNKSSLLPIINLENAQTLQLFTEIIKAERIIKSHQNCQTERLGWCETKQST